MLHIITQNKYARHSDYSEGKIAIESIVHHFALNMAPGPDAGRKPGSHSIGCSIENEDTAQHNPVLPRVENWYFLQETLFPVGISLNMFDSAYQINRTHKIHVNLRVTKRWLQALCLQLGDSLGAASVWTFRIHEQRSNNSNKHSNRPEHSQAAIALATE
jgi:hypothetical protein